MRKFIKSLFVFVQLLCKRVSGVCSLVPDDPRGVWTQYEGPTATSDLRTRVLGKKQEASAGQRSAGELHRAELEKLKLTFYMKPQIYQRPMRRSQIWSNMWPPVSAAASCAVWRRSNADWLKPVKRRYRRSQSMKNHLSLWHQHRLQMFEPWLSHRLSSQIRRPHLWRRSLKNRSCDGEQ